MDPLRARRLLAAALLMFFGAVDARAQTLRERIIAAEDSRNVTEVAIAPLLDGLRSPDPSIVALAARALGRFERPSFVSQLLPLLSHQRAEVRREAANALGQSLARIPRAGDASPPSEATLVTRALLDRLATDDDPSARGTIAETLGRLPFPSEQTARDVEAALRSLTQTLHPDVLTGAIKGADAWVRFNQARYPPAAETLERLRAVAVLPLHRLEPSYAFIRRIAWLTVNGARAADIALIKQGSSDPDAQLRRLSLLALTNAMATDEERRSVLGPALKDSAFQVRYDAVGVYSRLLQSGDCAPIVSALDDASVHVQLAAIDALATPCPAPADAAGRLVTLTEQLPPVPGDRIAWHRPAHALVSLAAVDRAAAGSRLPSFTSHPLWQVRARAARAAAVLRDAATLESLARDGSDNVRYEAILGLQQVAGHAADTLFVEALARPDYQVILAAAQALEGSPDRTTAVPALLGAFARLTAERRETSRDPRVALLVRLRELGSSSDTAALRPCLTDFDPVVAAECATTLQAWTGTPQTAQPVPLRTQPVDDLLPPGRARVVMSTGGTFEVTLFTGDTPATISRFARLARRGYYNGLTFHRVVPNFVIQGGSPGANEYAGDGPFMRDELALRSHTRGTVGLSTRGRDTGDAQFFINLLDNPRLDHEFTVFGEVTAGMDVVDAVLEGDAIARIELP